MIGDRRQLGGQRRAGWIAVELPQCAQRFGRCQRFVEPLQAALVDATDDGENQIVHRQEVVVQQLRLQSGLRRDLPRRDADVADAAQNLLGRIDERSEEHTSELQSLMRISYAVFGLKNKKNKISSNV